MEERVIPAHTPTGKLSQSTVVVVVAIAYRIRVGVGAWNRVSRLVAPKGGRPRVDHRRSVRGGGEGRGGYSISCMP